MFWFVFISFVLSPFHLFIHEQPLVMLEKQFTLSVA